MKVLDLNGRFKQVATNQGASGLLASVYNLFVANNSGSPNTKVDLKVGPRGGKWEAIVENASGIAQPASSTGTITINAGVNGANGLDTGSQAASTWYYIWIIFNGTTTAGMLSTSYTSPTLPSGYTFQGLIGGIYSNGSTQFQTTSQLDREVWTLAQNSGVNNSTGSSAWVSQSIATIVPPFATRISGIMGSSLVANGCQISIAGDGSGTGEKMHNAPPSSTSLFRNFYDGGVFTDLPLLTPQTFYWYAATGNANNRIDISSWKY